MDKSAKANLSFIQETQDSDLGIAKQKKMIAKKYDTKNTPADIGSYAQYKRRKIFFGSNIWYRRGERK